MQCLVRPSRAEPCRDTPRQPCFVSSGLAMSLLTLYRLASLALPHLTAPCNVASCVACNATSIRVLPSLVLPCLPSLCLAPTYQDVPSRDLSLVASFAFRLRDSPKPVASRLHRLAKRCPAPPRPVEPSLPCRVVPGRAPSRPACRVLCWATHA